MLNRFSGILKGRLSRRFFRFKLSMAMIILAAFISSEGTLMKIPLFQGLRQMLFLIPILILTLDAIDLFHEKLTQALSTSKSGHVEGTKQKETTRLGFQRILNNVVSNVILRYTVIISTAFFGLVFFAGGVIGMLGPFNAARLIGATFVAAGTGLLLIAGYVSYVSSKSKQAICKFCGAKLLPITGLLSSGGYCASCNKVQN